MKLKKFSYFIIFLFLFFILVIPFLYLFFQSFFNYNPFENNRYFIGIQNYLNLMKDLDFLYSLYNSFSFSFFSSILSVLFGIALYIILNKKKDIRFYIPFLVIPFFLSPVVVSILFFLIIDPQIGLLAGISTLLNFNFTNEIFGNKNLIFNALVITDIWQWSGIFFLLILLKIKSIQEKYSDLILTNNGDKRIFNVLIKMPYLFSFILALILFKFFWNLGFVEIIDTVTAGGSPHGSMRMFPIWIDRVYFRSSDFGYGASAAIIFYLISAIGLILFFFLIKKQTDLR